MRIQDSSATPASSIGVTNPIRGFRVASKITLVALSIITLLAFLPAKAEAGPIGAGLLPACLAGCVALVAGMTGGWGAVAAWFACKSGCIAIGIGV